MSLSLVILAAGMGSRYGGLKQLDPVGPAGETILDYAVFDSLRAGFTRVVFVIRRDFEAEFRAKIGAKYERVAQVDYVFQSMDTAAAGVTLPPERTKPWGTGHAVWCAASALKGPFSVINADDFYGRDSYAQLAKFLHSAPAGAGRPRFAMVGFRLDKTLSENGAVSRGVCDVGEKGLLHSVVEQTGITRDAVGEGKTYRGDAIVSMNCWGFTPELLPLLQRRLFEFWRMRATDPKAEFYLPAAVSAMVADGEADVTVLPTSAEWFGVTYREDRPRVAAALQALAARGDYPAGLGVNPPPAS